MNYLSNEDLCPDEEYYPWARGEMVSFADELGIRQELGLLITEILTSSDPENSAAVRLAHYLVEKFDL